MFSMEETHVCILDRQVSVHKARTLSTAEAIFASLAGAQQHGCMIVMAAGVHLARY